MFLFYVLSFFKKKRTLFMGAHYPRGDIIFKENMVFIISDKISTYLAVDKFYICSQIDV